MKEKNILLGLILIIVGIIAGLNALELTNINIFFKGWWTLFIILPSINGIIKEDDKTFSIITLLIGIGLFLGIRNILDFTIIFKLIVPIILIILGLSFVFKDTLGNDISKKIKELKNNNPEECYATFSTQDIKIEEEFNGISLNAIFGGITYDLKDAIIKEDVVINANCIFGGIEIKVPHNVKVVIKSNSIFGGMDNTLKPTKDKKEHTIYINGICLFGGVEIKWDNLKK